MSARIEPLNPHSPKGIEVTRELFEYLGEVRVAIEARKAGKTTARERAA